MQAPQPVPRTSRGKVGYIIVLVSSALVALSFLALPAVTYTTPSDSSTGIPGSMYSPSLLQIAQAFGGNGTLFGATVNPAGINPTSSTFSEIIWFLLVFAVITVIIALIFVIRPASRAVVGGIGIIIMSAIGATILAILMLIVGALSTSIPPSQASAGYSISVGIGGWLCFLGMVVAMVGGIVVVVTRSRVVVANAYSYVDPTMYPPQPFPPNYPPFPPQPFPPNYSQPPLQPFSPTYSPFSSQPVPPGYPPTAPMPSSPGYPPSENMSSSPSNPLTAPMPSSPSYPPSENMSSSPGNPPQL